MQKNVPEVFPNHSSRSFNKSARLCAVHWPSLKLLSCWRETLRRRGETCQTNCSQSSKNIKKIFDGENFFVAVTPTSCQIVTSSLTAYIREYWMIHRGPGFLAVVWFGSSPPALPPFPLRKLGLRHTGGLRKRDNWLIGEGGGVAMEPIDTTARKPGPLERKKERKNFYLSFSRYKH